MGDPRSFVVLLGWIPLRQRMGVGTIANAILVGVVIDVVLALFEPPQALWARIALLVGGVVGNGIATGLYIGAGLGPGARDGLTTGIAARGHSIRVVRTTIEAAVLVDRLPARRHGRHRHRPLRARHRPDHPPHDPGARDRAPPAPARIRPVGRLVSVNVGTPKQIGVRRGRPQMSAIGKAPVDRPRPVEGVNLAGDDQADRRVHGGPDKAVYAYASEDIAWWSRELRARRPRPGDLRREPHHRTASTSATP